MRNGPHGERRPAAVKTGTANDARDLVDLRLPGAAGQPQGARPGRRRVDGQQRPLDAAVVGPGDLAHRGRAAVAVVRPPADQRASRSPTSASPRASSRTRIDAWSGGAPGPWTRADAHGAVPRGHPAGRARARSTSAGPAVQRGRAARGSSTRSRPSSGRAAGTTTSRTGSPAPAAASASLGRSTRGRRTSGTAPAGAGRSPARATSRRAVGPWQRATAMANGHGNGHAPPGPGRPVATRPQPPAGPPNAAGMHGAPIAMRT